MNNYAGTLIRDIKIYPSSWYYNACVHGFLEILAWGLGEEGDRIIEEQILQHDGTALIPSELAKAIFSTESVPMPDGYAERAVPDDLEGMKRIAWWWIVVSYKAGYMTGNDKNKSLDNHELVETVCGSLFNFKSQYPNLVNLGQLTNDTAKKIEFLNNWFTHDKHNGHYNVNCSFCGSNYSPDQDGRIYDLFFTRLLSIVLGNGPEVFPNRFWDGKPNLTICKRCRSHFLSYHIVQRNRFFINSDSLRVNWYINRLLASKLRQNRFAYQKALPNALQYDPQLRKGIGSWGLQNLEALVLEWDKVSYYPISPRLARMFLVPQFASKMSSIANERVWDVILKERFDYLPTIIYKSLRAYLAKGNKLSDPEVVYEPLSIQPVVDLITLNGEIIRLLSKEKGDKVMDYINTGQLRKLGADSPLSQDDDNLVFRLLELTRLNRKDDVYHLLLRVYIARNIEFPSRLAEVFTVSSSELFKTGIYAYISGLRLKGQTEANGN